MKISNGTELRFTTPKYSRIWSPLFGVGFAFIAIFHFVYPKSPNWVSGIGFLFILAGLVVSFLGAIAERREWQAQHQADKN